MPKKADAEQEAVTPSDAEDAQSHEQAQSYEQARDELAQVVSKLEAGGITLEESLQLWERGERLAGVCQEWLDGARKRLAAIAPNTE